MTEKYKRFQEKYKNNFEGFIRDCIFWTHLPNKEPKPWQLDTAKRLLDSELLLVNGNRGIGKTTLAAWALLWFSLTRDGTYWHVYMTASEAKQIQDLLFPAVHKWASLLRWDTIGRNPFTRGELKRYGLDLRTGEIVYLVAAIDSIYEAVDDVSGNVLFLFDEAWNVPEEYFEFVGDLKKEKPDEVLCLGLSTVPKNYIGRFWEICTYRKYSDWAVKLVSKDDYKNTVMGTEDSYAKVTRTIIQALSPCECGMCEHCNPWDESGLYPTNTIYG